MSRYQHTKGQIKDNAIEALLHDPLFRQRVEKNKKGKGSYLRKEKHNKGGNWEASGKQAKRLFTTGLLVLSIKKATFIRWLFIGITKRCFTVLAAVAGSASHEFPSAVSLLR